MIIVFSEEFLVNIFAIVLSIYLVLICQQMAESIYVL